MWWWTNQLISNKMHCKCQKTKPLSVLFFDTSRVNALYELRSLGNANCTALQRWNYSTFREKSHHLFLMANTANMFFKTIQLPSLAVRSVALNILTCMFNLEIQNHLNWEFWKSLRHVQQLCVFKTHAPTARGLVALLIILKTAHWIQQASRYLRHAWDQLSDVCSEIQVISHAKLKLRS